MEERNVTSLDFGKFKIGQKILAQLRSFSIRKAYFVGTFIYQDQQFTAILGKKSELSFAEVFANSKKEYELTFWGLKESEGVKYPKWSVKTVG